MTFSKFRWNDHPLRVKLKGVDAALATVMFNKANIGGTDIYGSQENLAELLGASVSSVYRAQQRLQQLGLIERDGKRGSGRSGRSTKWRLTMPPNTGHRSDEYRSPVQEIPVTGDRLIDPLIDPGNRPGSCLSTTAGEDIKSEPALGAVSVAHIAVPAGTALVHQPPAESEAMNDHPSGLSEEDRAAIMADLYQRDAPTMPALAGWDGSGTPWPRDEAIPDDPWGTPYYDAQTGEHFEYRPGQLPVVVS